MTSLLAAGFHDIAHDYHVTSYVVSLTAGLFMLGMGIGGVVISPTAMLFGKRPMYLLGCLLLIGTSVWCALAPTFLMLLIARVAQGFEIAPVEVLPSATVSEIFFLHERAFRLAL